MMGYPDYGLHPQFTIGPITVGSQQSVPITTHTVTGGGNTLTPQTVTGGGGTLTPRTVTGGPTFTPVTPRTVTPVTPRTVTPITPGTFPTFRAAGLDDYGGLGGYGGYGYGGYDDLSGVAPQFTIGPITVGSQQSVPITTHTVTGGGNTLTPQTVTGGGGTLTPRTVTGGPTFTPVTPRTVTPVTPRTVTPITPGTFPTFRAAGLDDLGGLGGYGGYGYGGYDDLSGVAPQFTIGPITVGSQQSVPITTHTVTGGGNTADAADHHRRRHLHTGDASHRDARHATHGNAGHPAHRDPDHPRHLPDLPRRRAGRLRRPGGTAVTGTAAMTTSAGLRRSSPSGRSPLARSRACRSPPTR